MVDLAVQNSSDLFLKRKRVLAYAAQKVGKTVLGGTISELCPDELAEGRPAPKFTMLEDIVNVSFDGEGVEAYVPLNIDVPTIDLSLFSYAAKMQEKGRLLQVNDAIDRMFELVNTRMQKGLTGTAIFDTGSTLNNIFVGYHTSIAEDGNKEKIYEGVLDKHIRFVNQMKALPGNWVMLAHAQAKFFRTSKQDPNGTQFDIKSQADATGGQFEEIQPEFSGKGAGLYKKAASIICPLFLEVKGGKKRRYIMPEGGNNAEGGHRYADLLGKEEPAHLNMLYKKLRAGVAARKAA